LDLSGLPYTEDAHPPGIHVLYTLPFTNYKSSMTPLLLTRDSKTPAVW